jgi:hypothetical protein
MWLMPNVIKGVNADWPAPEPALTMLMDMPRWRAKQFATIVVTGEWRMADASEAAL